MPIRNVVERYNPGRGMEQIGRLYKGAARTDEDKGANRPGKDLDYFRVKFNDTRTDPAYLAVFEQLYGVKAELLDDAYLIAPTPDSALDSWLEEWGSGGLYHRCDGVEQAAWFDRSRGKVIHDQPAPCARVNGGSCACKQIGRVNLFLPRYCYASGLFGYFTLMTHSIKDIVHINAVLNDVHNIRGSLVNVPFTVYREFETIEQPEIDKKTKQPTGNRIHIKKSLIRIRVQAGFVQDVAARFLSGGDAPAQLDAPALKALPAPAGDRWGKERALKWGRNIQRDTGLNDREILTALGVNTLGEWAGDEFSASARVNAWITEQQQSSN